jgi:hypothetical protein
MINKKTLDEINSKLEAKQHAEEILRAFESPYVETTVGLVEVNSASKHEAKHSDHATWLHRHHPQIEAALKAHAAGMLKVEIGKIEAWLSERHVS